MNISSTNYVIVVVSCLRCGSKGKKIIFLTFDHGDPYTGTRLYILELN